MSEETNYDLEVMKHIRKYLNNITPDARVAVLEYCLFVANKDCEG